MCTPNWISAVFLLIWYKYDVIGLYTFKMLPRSEERLLSRWWQGRELCHTFQEIKTVFG